MDTIRIFVGTEKKTEIFRQVLEFSILRRTHHPVEFTPMIGPDWEYSLEGIKVGTGFSLRRWMIPAACGYEGKAIYLDADQLVFGDIAELWNKDKEKALNKAKDPVIWCSFQPDKYSKTPWPQTSVMLMDCGGALGPWGFNIEKILVHLRENQGTKPYADLMHAAWIKNSVAQIGDEWNSLNRFVPKEQSNYTKLIHFTKENTQPTYCPELPLADLWQAELQEAIKADAVSKQDYELALSKWAVKEDWRPTNGLHPFYKRYLDLFPKG